MIRASDLLGLPVVDLVQAEKLGRVQEIVIDPDARVISAFLVKDQRILSRRRRQVVPAARVYAIGPQALTLETVANLPDSHEIDGLPTLSELAGRKVLSRHGKLLGSVGDVLIDEETGQVIGYALDVPHATAGIGMLQKGQLWPDYVRAEAPLRISRSLIITPDEALVRGDMTRQEMEIRRARTGPAVGWAQAPVVDRPLSPALVSGPAIARLPAPEPERQIAELEQTRAARALDSHAA